MSNSASVTLLASATATLSASAGVLMSYFKVCGLRITLTAVGSATVPPSPLASAPSLSIAFTKRHPNGVPPFWIAFSNFSFVKSPSGAGVPVYVITVGFSAVAVVSEVNLFAVNPYWVSCLLVSPATSLNGWLEPLLNSALASLPLSSWILISKEFTSDAYTYTSFLLGAGSEYWISTVGFWFVRATLETGAVSTESSLYVTVTVPLATAISFTTEDLGFTTSPFLDASRASSLVALSEYWILISFLILVISASVKLSTFETAILASFDSGCWISYLYVWDLTTKLNAPGAFKLLPPASLAPVESSSCRYLAPNTARWSSVFV